MATRRRTSVVRRNQVEDVSASDEQMREELESVASQLDEGSPIHPEEPEETEIEEPVTSEPADEITVSATPTQAGQSSPITFAALQASGMSKVQAYSIVSMMVFADLAVQKSPDEVFDVLARNFPDHGFLSWFLNRIGRNELTKYAKGRDLVEYIRKVAHELFYRDLKDVGKPIARF